MHEVSKILALGIHVNHTVICSGLSWVALATTHHKCTDGNIHASAPKDGASTWAGVHQPVVTPHEEEPALDCPAVPSCLVQPDPPAFTMGSTPVSSTWNCACPCLWAFTAQGCWSKAPSRSNTQLRVRNFYLKQPQVWGVNKHCSRLRAVMWGDMSAKQDPECPEHFTQETHGITQAERDISNSSLKGRWGSPTTLNRHLLERHCTLILLEGKQLHKMFRG